MSEPALDSKDNAGPIDAPHKAYIRSLNQIDRDRLGHLIGVSGAYVTSLLYRDARTVSLQMAIAIDKHSNGAYDFRNLVAREEAIDWEFIRQRLNRDYKP